MKKAENLIPLFLFSTVLVDMVAHPETVAAVIKATNRIRCPICGYIMGHPVVRHQFPWNSHTNIGTGV